MIQNVWDWLGEVKTLAVRCRQFGDTGKGKFVDYFAEWADIIAWGTGGANVTLISVGPDRDETVFVKPPLL